MPRRKRERERAETECVLFCVVCSPEFRFSDHIERPVPVDDDQPKKMLLKRDPDSCEVHDVLTGHRSHTPLTILV